MRQSCYSEEQIIGMLREHEAGVKTKELCRNYGISDATFYRYKATFVGMMVSDPQLLRTPDAENAKLKRLLAEQMLDIAALKDLASKDF
ncbi:MAG: putative transposase [Maricaulis maris]|uniref:Transposase IS3/IS911 family protein n=1 Tax=Maricaulis maris (strain MCS10) TaxID=394221 RepID=Q0AL00_MARMM|nr:transposase [Maricaulis maris]ABI67043.1 transposase IS3/IS911 family protein [Maricaulis maris MCS10]